MTQNTAQTFDDKTAKRVSCFMDKTLPKLAIAFFVLVTVFKAFTAGELDHSYKLETESSVKTNVFIVYRTMSYLGNTLPICFKNYTNSNDAVKAAKFKEYVVQSYLLFEEFRGNENIIRLSNHFKAEALDGVHAGQFDARLMNSINDDGSTAGCTLLEKQWLDTLKQ